MAGFNLLPLKFLRRKTPNSVGIDPSIQSTQPVILKPSAPSGSPAKKSLATLAKEAEAQYYATYPDKPSKPAKSKRGGVLNKLIWAAVLIGIPVGVVYIANLPYPVIRRPVVRTAPILLLPSYINIEENYRQAIASVEQAQQLIERPTSQADLESGEQKVKEAQKHLDALPMWFIDDWREYSLWYDWRFSPYGFYTARKQVGELQAKVFQEKNAQVLLVQSEQALNAAKQQYQQASTPTDKQLAIAAWHSAIDQLQQIPSTTLAGRTAQSKRENYQRDFKDIVGLAAGNERISTLIAAAQQFSFRAAQMGQNPPHSVDEWEQVENLWRDAINRLERISSDDLAGYAQAQRLLAEYKTNLGQISIRKQAEANSVRAFERAQSQIESLQRYASTSSPDYTISQLSGIINELRKVQNGTTVYLETQNLLLSAQNKLNQLQPQ
ncbi:MAG: hypothetical protein KME06_08410 [Kastovskya adunca ATA6-11-RM4]|jgi:hypothetical protein|nr:hypothetical protein [Kastovskya adunca ATA6-11-RM4]